MTLSSPAPVRLDDGEITVEAEILAPKLGLTVVALKENMAKGLVMSVAETGENEDAGRTRLTFRYRARVWRVVIGPDGRLSDDPLPAPQAKPVKGPPSLLDLVKLTS